jgi:flagellin-like protein
MEISRREAISPVIATIIIIAVTIAISLAVAAWLMGLWSGFVGGPRITASLINMTQTIPTGGNPGDVFVAVMFMNTGSSSDKIQSLSVVTLRVGAYTLTCTEILNATDSSKMTPPISIDPTPPGTGVTLKFKFKATPPGGATAVNLVGSIGTIEIRLTSGNTIVLSGSITKV